MTFRPRGHPSVQIATCLGVGYFPVAPGTLGSLVGVAILIALRSSPFAATGLRGAVGLSALLIFAVGVMTAGRAAIHLGSPDPNPVVIDEVTGQLVTFVAQPQIAWPWVLLAFGLFRLVDWRKPFGIRRLEALPGAWGIMADDVGAGLACALFIALLRLAVN